MRVAGLKVPMNETPSPLPLDGGGRGGLFYRDSCEDGADDVVAVRPLDDVGLACFDGCEVVGEVKGQGAGGGVEIGGVECLQHSTFEGGSL